MGIITVNIHSTSDTITNSSTTVFIYPRDTAIEMAKELLTELMSEFGISGSVDDYFEFSIKPDPEWVEDKRDERQSEREDHAEDEPVEDYTLSDEEFEEYINKGIDDSYSWHNYLQLNIVSKKNSKFNFSEKFLAMFEMEGYSG